jgi:GPCR-chaperone
VIDLMSVRNQKFSRLKSFIQLQLPSGFPVRISIPLVLEISWSLITMLILRTCPFQFHMINAQVTFKNVNEPALPPPRDTNATVQASEEAATEAEALVSPDFQLAPSLFAVPEDFTVHTTNASLLFDHLDQGVDQSRPRASSTNNRRCESMNELLISKGLRRALFR